MPKINKEEPKCKQEESLLLLAMLIAIPTIFLSTVRAAEEGSDITKITVVKEGKDINDIKYDGRCIAFLRYVGGMTRKAIKIQHFVLIQ